MENPPKLKCGPCAKKSVTAILIRKRGGPITGINLCLNPQDVCPREPGEDYTKCATVCQQIGHAEYVALRMAGDTAKGGTMFVYHKRICSSCEELLRAAGLARYECMEGR